MELDGKTALVTGGADGIGAELAVIPPVLTPADIADAAMEFVADDTLAGRVMVCRGDAPYHLIPLIDWQTV